MEEHSRPGTDSGPAKMLLPRLNRPPGPLKPKLETRRVAKACTNCRKRKVRCTGETPKCKLCEESGALCTYEPHRKDRLKSQIERNRDLVTLLRDLSMRVGAEDKGKISRMLDGAESDEGGGSTTSRTSQDQEYGDAYDDEESGHQTRRDASSITDDYSRILSTTDVDPQPHELGSHLQPGGPSGTLAEDLLRSQSSRETGFVGAMSEIHWLRIFLSHAQPAYPGAIASPRNDFPQHMERFSYYLDDRPVELDIFIHAEDLPDVRTARNLFSCYISYVHQAFPILPTAFIEHFEKWCNSIELGNPMRTHNTWKALLNLVFAIGATFSHQVDAEWQGDENDHKVYLARATQLLGIKETILFLSAPDGTLIQALGLLSFYFLAVGHVSRAWSMIGMSLRSALSVGLHLRNGDASVRPDKREALARTWWSLHGVESALSSITGRPSVIANEHIAVPLPKNLSHTGNPKAPMGLLPLLDAHIMIGLITQDVLTHLYSQRIEGSTSGQIQVITASLMATLNDWARQALPPGYDTKDPVQEIERSRQIFVFYYFKTKILITRPCLQRLNTHVRDRSGESPEVIKKMAEDCVNAALDLTFMLPDPPDVRWIYESGPWWSIVHSIMQAITVLILEMTYGIPTQEGGPYTAQTSIIKLLRWLQCLRVKNAVAKRAYDLISSILLDAHSPSPVSIREFLLQDPPERHQDVDFGAPQVFLPYDSISEWHNALGPEPMASVHGHDELDFTVPSQPFPTLEAVHPDGTLFPPDLPYETSHPERPGELSYLLQPGAALDMLVDPWNSEQDDETLHRD